MTSLVGQGTIKIQMYKRTLLLLWSSSVWANNSPLEESGSTAWKSSHPKSYIISFPVKFLTW